MEGTEPYMIYELKNMYVNVKIYVYVDMFLWSFHTQWNWVFSCLPLSPTKQNYLFITCTSLWSWKTLEFFPS